MNNPLLIVIDDASQNLKPLNDFRAIFDQRTGAFTTVQRVQHLYNRAVDALFVPADLLELTQQHHPDTSINQIIAEESGRPAILINGRCLIAGLEEAWQQLKPGTALIEPDGDVVAMHTRGGEADPTLENLNNNASLSQLAKKLHHVCVAPQTLINRPWHLISRLPQTLRHDLAHSDLVVLEPTNPDPLQSQTPAGLTVMPGPEVDSPHRLHVADSAKLAPNITINLEHGSVVIDQDATIQPFAVIEGPCYIGMNTTIAAHSHLRPNTTIGPCCKVGGEISHSIIQGYSNKAHTGYLGHSIVGEWCNLGANTNVSNLKNTLGSIRVRLHPDDQQTQDTGLDKLGPMLGDFVRTGIGTHILTGSVIPSGVMIAGLPFAPKVCQPFGFYTSHSEVNVHEIEPMLTTLRRMMSKHGVELSTALEQRIRKLMDQVER